MMQLGCDGVFVGSGIFKSSDPVRRAKAIVEAVANYKDPAVIARVSEDLGEAMESRTIEELDTKMAERGWWFSSFGVYWGDYWISWIVNHLLIFRFLCQPVREYFLVVCTVSCPVGSDYIFVQTHIPEMSERAVILSDFYDFNVQTVFWNFLLCFQYNGIFLRFFLQNALRKQYGNDQTERTLWMRLLLIRKRLSFLSSENMFLSITYAPAVIDFLLMYVEFQYVYLLAFVIPTLLCLWFLPNDELYQKYMSQESPLLSDSHNLKFVWNGNFWGITKYLFIWLFFIFKFLFV